MAELIEGETVYDEIKISHEKSLIVSWTQLVKIPADTYKGMIPKNWQEKQWTPLSINLV